ncbi:hypothetical protein AVEN_232339-1 [Araneus ventricosus]|uniref:Uncharacterized protein n=1 Tax=Araneus ventricosus TaxID=182803 RepID=A0A4Y2I8T3_ARAVE|nr:hypothetical protein AVEN_232339-1 [Araneus ventricosus]
MLSGEMSTSLQLESKTTRKAGKLKSAVSSTTNSAAENEKESRKFRLFVRDRRSNLRFLIDQTWANYGPRANSGPPEGFIRPADRILICRSDGN